MSPRPALVEEDAGLWEHMEAEAAHGSGPPAVNPAPALGYSITANLGGNTQIVVQCFAGEDEPDAIVNGKIDRVMRVIDRQRAKYEIIDLRSELDTLTLNVARARENLAIIDRDTEKRLAQFDVQILETQRSKQATLDKWYAHQRGTGRSGTGQPGGSTKSSLDGHEAAIKSYQEQKESLKAEQAKGRAEFDANLPRFNQEVERIQAKIAEKEALLNGA